MNKKHTPYFNQLKQIWYGAGYRAGVKRGKTIAINTCMALGRLTGQPKGFYKALGEVIDNLELK